MRVRSSAKPEVVIAAAPMLHRSTVRAACSRRSMSRSDSSMNAGEIVAVGRRLRRLSVGIGDDDGVALALGHRQQGLDHRGMLR